MKDKKIRRFLLTDNADEFYTDLIEFDKPVLLSDVEYAVNKCKTELVNEYTNEDIYNYLDNLGVDYKIIFLGNYDTIYY